MKSQNIYDKSIKAFVIYKTHKVNTLSLYLLANLNLYNSNRC